MTPIPVRSAAVLALAITSFVGASASSAPLVLRAQGPTVGKLKPGSELSTDKLRLKAGDSVTILDEQGTRTFQGPGTFRLYEESRPRGSEDEMQGLLEAQANEKRKAVAAAARREMPDKNKAEAARRAIADFTRRDKPEADSNKAPDEQPPPQQ
jgi:hypothetical protein